MVAWNGRVPSFILMEDIQSKVGCLHVEVSICSLVQNASLELVPMTGAWKRSLLFSTFSCNDSPDNELYVFKEAHIIFIPSNDAR